MFGVSLLIFFSSSCNVVLEAFIYGIDGVAHRLDIAVLLKLMLLCIICHQIFIL